MVREIGRIKGSPVGGLTRPGEAVPINIPPLLRRFYNFAREMAKKFSKSLLKERDEEFLKVVEKDFRNKD